MYINSGHDISILARSLSKETVLTNANIGKFLNYN